MVASDGLPVDVFSIRLSTWLAKPMSLAPTESVKTLMGRLPMICLTSVISAGSCTEGLPMLCIGPSNPWLIVAPELATETNVTASCGFSSWSWSANSAGPEMVERWASAFCRFIAGSGE